MMFKSPVIPPLETIYEESGSFVSSTIESFRQRSNFQSPTSPLPQTINGLISARSIPTVDVQRQRARENQNKRPPIEVRYRDGSKKFIPPTQPSHHTPISNRRNLFPSSSIVDDHQYKFYSTPSKTLPNDQISKPTIVLTIITANDLDRAGITPSVASSADDSERSFLGKSLSNSSIETTMTIQDPSETSTLTIEHDIHPSPRLPVKNILPQVSAPVKSNTNNNNHQKPLPIHLGSGSAFRPVVKMNHSQLKAPSYLNSTSTYVNGRSYQNERPSILPNLPANPLKPPTKQVNMYNNASKPPLPPPKPQLPSIPTKSQSSRLIDPHGNWYQITSNSIYDVPRLSNQYAHVPLHINIPVRTPTHNQKLLIKHDAALEKRLLNAGVSPETVALYERLLYVADPESKLTSVASLKTPVHVHYTLRS